MRSFSNLCILLSTVLQAQVHEPLFNEPSRMWTTEFSGTVDAQCMDHWTTTYWISGDTLINGSSYSVIRNRIAYWQSTIMAMNCTTWVETDGEALFVREEDQQVFIFISPGNESLIYDFTAEVGDSIPYPSNFPTNNSWLDRNNWIDVIAIDSIEVNGMFRKRFIVESIQNIWDTVSVIEGIGGSYGPFQPLIRQIGLSHGAELHCVRELGVVIYGDPFCWMITDVRDGTAAFISAPYPNPSFGMITLDGGVRSSQLIDATGRNIANAQGHLIDLSGLDEGIYSIRGWDLHGRLVGSWPVMLMQLR